MRISEPLTGLFRRLVPPRVQGVDVPLSVTLGRLMAATAVLGASLLCLLAWRAHDTILGDHEAQVMATTRIVSEHVNNVISSQRLALKVVEHEFRTVLISDGPDFGASGKWSDFSARLKGYADLQPYSANLHLIDPSGRIIASTAGSNTSEIDVGDRSYFRALIAPDAPPFVISERFQGRINGRTLFAVGQRVTGANGDMLGIVISTIDVTVLQMVFHEATAITGSVISLNRWDGEILAGWPAAPLVGFTRRVPLPPPLRDGLSEGSIIAHSNVDAVERIFGFARIGNFPLYVAHGVAMSEVWAAWRRQFMPFGLIVAPVTLGLLIALGIARRRARELASAMATLQSEIKRREEAEAALRHTQKIEALGKLTGGVAHDFNNLLAAIGASLRVLRRLVPPSALAQIANAESAVTRGAHLSRQLLSVARHAPTRPELLELGATLHELMPLLTRSVPPSITIGLSGPTTPMHVKMDRTEFELAILNLVTNARDAMPDGGHIEVGVTAAAPLDPDRTLQDTAAPYAEIFVRDEGAGMDAATAARIFEPFFTTKPLGKGTGLGLSMVDGFVRSNDGHALVDTAPGKGTCIRLCLPLSAETPGRAIVPVSAACGQRLGKGFCSGGMSAGQRMRILLVEDEALVRIAMSAELEQLGLDVTPAADGVDALSILDQTDGGFDAVLTDVAMPNGVSGIDVALHVRKRWPQMTVILTTGYSPEMLSQDVQQLGIPLLVKPHGIRDLLKILHESMTPHVAA